LLGERKVTPCFVHTLHLYHFLQFRHINSSDNLFSTIKRWREWSFNAS